MLAHRLLRVGLVVAVLVVVGALYVLPVRAGTGVEIVVNSLADTSGTCSQNGTGTCTLRDALAFANAQENQTTYSIKFSVTGTIPLTASLTGIVNEVTIDGSGQQVTVSGEGAHRVFTVRRTGDVTLVALTIANGGGKADCGGSYKCGGGIKNRGVLTVKNSVIENNNGDWYGGAIANQGPSLVIDNSIFNNNVTSDYYGLGGAIFNNNGDVTIGGNSSFTGNTGFQGGAIYHSLGALSINASTFSQNSADEGGALFLGFQTSVSNTLFSENNTGSSADGTMGGAIYTAGTLQVTNSSFTNNSTCPLCFGGAIGNDNGTVKVKKSTFTGNYAQYGGAIYNNLGTFNLSASTVNDNKGWEGGGGAFNDSGTLNILNSTFTENHAPAGNGGALYNLDGTLLVSSSTVWSNHAFPSVFDAGGIYNDGNKVTLLNSIVADNSNYQCYDYAESLTADKYNLDDDGSCNNATQKTPAQIDLGDLKDNGGPTQTLKPGSNSPAINGGSNAVCPPNDQRGVKRPQKVNCDVGAYEVR